MKKLISLITLLLSMTVSAQKIEVKGQIKNSHNEIVPFASVVFKSFKYKSKVYGILGDENGNFAIEIPKDNYTVEISVVGIEPKILELDLKKKKGVFDIGDIVVSTEVSLDEVIVKSNQPAYKIDLDKKTYNISQDIVTKGGTLTDIMQNLPSVQVESDGNVSIRGDQNVRILVDGKPSGLTSSAELFSSIPASSIEKIEVITNPSSKYSAQGSAGIINLVLKKGQKKRYNSSIEIFTGYRFNSGVNGNIYRNGESNSWYTNAGVGYSEPKATNNVFLRSPNDVINISNQNSNRIRNQGYYLLNMGGTKNLNKKNAFSGSITYRGAQSDNSNIALYEDFNNEILLNKLNRDEIEDETNRFISGNISFDHKFKKEGHQLTASISGEFSQDNEGSTINSKKIFPTQQTLNQDFTKNNEKINRYVGSVDYTLPIEKNGVLELGYRSDLSSIENDFSVKRQSEDSSYTIPEFTDSTNYDERIYAFYGQISKQIKNISIKLGLRTEISDINISSERKNFSNEKNYMDWFPSVFVDYSFNEKNKVQFSASRRINRPRSWTIVPFSTFTDERNTFVGNADINPSYVFATELDYTTEISDKFSFYPSLYYRKTSDEMELFVEKQQITIGNKTQDIFASTIANIGDYTAYGAELGVSYKPFNWWNMFAEIVLNGFIQRGSFRGASFDGEGLLFSGRYNTTINFFKSMKFQIQNFYRGPIETGQYRRKGFYGVNIGLSNDLFKGKGTISLNVRDVFNSNKRLVTTFGEDFKRDLELQYRVRQINLSVTYRFNHKQYKGKKGNQFDTVEIVN